MRKKCAYCGEQAQTVDHVIPKCLYPKSIGNQKVQRLTVPSCNKCNSEFSDDEQHFRNIITVGGHNTAIVNELYYDKVYRSFSEKKSLRHFWQLVNNMEEINTPNGKRHIIYPMKDKKFERILRKIFRGLGYHHFECCVSNENIKVDILRDKIPEFILEGAKWYNFVPEVFEYIFDIYLTDEGYISCWMVKFFENRYFLGTINMTEEMMFDRERVIDLRKELT
jgi:hypothetical protein